MFYDTTAVRRKGAVPAPLANLLFGRGAVHGLDDHEHAERKRIFDGVYQHIAVLADGCAHPGEAGQSGDALGDERPDRDEGSGTAHRENGE